MSRVDRRVRAILRPRKAISREIQEVKSALVTVWSCVGCTWAEDKQDSFAPGLWS